MNFDYYIPTRILFGAGRLNDLHKQKLPGKKALIVISNGKSTRANGYLARVEKELELAGAAHVVFDKVQPNPTKDNVMEGAALARAEAAILCSVSAAGRPIDAAKAIAVMAAIRATIGIILRPVPAKGSRWQIRRCRLWR